MQNKVADLESRNSPEVRFSRRAGKGFFSKTEKLKDAAPFLALRRIWQREGEKISTFRHSPAFPPGKMVPAEMVFAQLNVALQPH